MIDIELFPEEIQILFYYFQVIRDNNKATIIQSYWRRKLVNLDLNLILINVLDEYRTSTYRFLGIDITNPYVCNILVKLSKNIDLKRNKNNIYQNLCYDLDNSIAEYVYFSGPHSLIYNKSEEAYKKIKKKIVQLGVGRYD